MNYNFFDKSNLLKLKNKFKKLDSQNYYFQSNLIKNKNNIEYRIAKSFWPIPNTPDSIPYQKYINKNKNSLSTSFYNLNKDTLLIIPIKPYANIVDFAKRGTEREWLALWRKVKKCTNNLKDYYISTHGHGVSWLHVRIEKIPKYYSY